VDVALRQKEVHFPNYSGFGRGNSVINENGWYRGIIRPISIGWLIGGFFIFLKPSKGLRVRK